MHFRVRSLDELKIALAKQRITLVSIPIHPGWHKAVSGLIEIPPAFPTLTEYHCVAIERYDDPKKLLYFWNNWGSHWGNSGYGYLPYEYFERFCNDAWAFEPAPQLLLKKNQYREHLFIIKQGGYPNVLGPISIVVDLWDTKSFVRVGWCFATIRDEWFEIEDFFIRPDYQADKRHFSSLLAEALRTPISRRLAIRYWIPDADTHSGSGNFPVANALIRQLHLRIKQSGVSWAPYRGELQIPLSRLPDGIRVHWPDVMSLRARQKQKASKAPSPLARFFDGPDKVKYTLIRCQGVRPRVGYGTIDID